METRAPALPGLPLGTGSLGTAAGSGRLPSDLAVDTRLLGQVALRRSVHTASSPADLESSAAHPAHPDPRSLLDLGSLDGGGFDLGDLVNVKSDLSIVTHLGSSLLGSKGGGGLAGIGLGLGKRSGVDDIERGLLDPVSLDDIVDLKSDLNIVTHLGSDLLGGNEGAGLLGLGLGKRSEVVDIERALLDPVTSLLDLQGLPLLGSPTDTYGKDCLLSLCLRSLPAGSGETVEQSERGMLGPAVDGILPLGQTTSLLHDALDNVVQLDSAVPVVGDLLNAPLPLLGSATSTGAAGGLLSMLPIRRDLPSDSHLQQRDDTSESAYAQPILGSAFLNKVNLPSSSGQGVGAGGKGLLLGGQTAVLEQRDLLGLGSGGELLGGLTADVSALGSLNTTPLLKDLPLVGGLGLGGLGGGLLRRDDADPAPGDAVADAVQQLGASLPKGPLVGDSLPQSIEAADAAYDEEDDGGSDE